MSLSTLILLAIALVLAVVLSRSVLLVREGQCVVVDRLGRPHRIAAAGLHLLVPVVDHARGTVDLAARSIPLDPIDAVSADGRLVQVQVELVAVIADPLLAATNTDLHATIVEAILEPVRTAVETLDAASLPDHLDRVDGELHRSVPDRLEQVGVRADRLRAVRVVAHTA